MASKKSVDRARSNVEGFCDTKIKAATDAGNAGLAKKWTAVKVDLMAMAEVVAELGFDKAPFIPDAIYAAQKTERILRTAATKIDVLDRYTRNLVQQGMAERNGGVLSNQLQNAALSKGWEGDFGEALDRRLSSHTTTATTQASSSRAALKGLGLAVISNRVLTFTLDNPLGESILRALGMISDEEPAVESDPAAEPVAEATGADPIVADAWANVMADPELQAIAEASVA